MSDPIADIHDTFLNAVSEQDFPASDVHSNEFQSSLDPQQAIEIFTSMITSRCLDLHSRVMQKQGMSFYTIGSSGHEGNAAISAALNTDDMAFLHYRSGAFLIQRAAQAGQTDIIREMLLSFAASSDDPVSAGRHKVLGSKSLFIPPQTSTIASHLPKAVGAAFSLGLAGHLKLDAPLRSDSVVFCNFGDASANHSTAQGAINSACWAAFQNIPLPLVFVCEDNGIGISTSTPKGWIAANHRWRPGLNYIYCDGLNIFDVYDKALQAVKVARSSRKPVFLHMRTVRLYGHAGSDAEFKYRSKEQIAATERQDPLLHTARLCIERGILKAEHIIDLYQTIRDQVESEAERINGCPKLTSAKQVMESLVPAKRSDIKLTPVDDAERQNLLAHDKHNLNKPQHMAKLINWALFDIMAERNNTSTLR